MVYESQKHFEEAENLLKEAITDTRRETLGWQNRETIISMEVLMRMYERQGEAQ